MKSIHLLAGLALALSVVTGCGPQADGNKASSKPELHIYTWSDYIAPSVIQEFEKKHNCKVVIDTFDSNETMYAKLKAGATGYDIIMPSSYQIKTMVSEGMIQPLDHTKLPNVRKNFDKNFTAQIIDPTFAYNVPYAVTYTGFAYLKDKMPAGADVNSWSILANSALRGKISLLDDQREVIGAGLMSLGYSINSTSAEEIDKAVAEVLKWKQNIRKFDAESYKTEVASGAILLGHGYSTDVTQLIVGDEDEGTKPRPDVGFALPKEGFSVAFDEMVIAKGAKQVDLAYAFINTIYDPEVAKENMEYIGGPNPVAPAIAMLDEDYRKIIILDDATLKRGQVLQSFDGKPEIMELYNKAWDKIKASR
ncbi:MAG: spermidine/putrescine ABC transporter substrate-binding protein [Kiritimatiellae bacterium]|nr:spermidine/putrescine ABC transporter substrate-binding protein [Kiritimatiellia bacterium]